MEKLKDDKKDEKKDKKAVENKLTPEEEEMKKNLDDMIEALFDLDNTIKENAFNLLKKEITGSTGSMTTIPKPLKFLRPHFEKLRTAYHETENLFFKKLLGDLLCILVLVTDTPDSSLKYILENNLTNFSEWGHELVRSLSGEITTEYLKRLEEQKPYDDLMNLVKQITNDLIASNNENEAIDLLVELDLIDEVKSLCSEKNHKKFCSYLLAISNYSAESSEQKKILEIVFELFSKHNEYTNALRVAIKLNERNLILSTITSCSSKATKLQMAFILARAGVYIESQTLDQDVMDVMRGMKNSEYFKLLVRNLDILEPKTPEDIFKSHLEEKKEGIQLESYKINMATSIVSSFINAGFGTEKLIKTNKKDDTDWLAKNKEEGLMCALAGLGLVNIWDIECGPNEVEKYMDVNEMNPYKRGGYNIALGIISSGIYDENNTAFALLSEQTKDKK